MHFQSGRFQKRENTSIYLKWKKVRLTRSKLHSNLFPELQLKPSYGKKYFENTKVMANNLACNNRMFAHSNFTMSTIEGMLLIKVVSMNQINKLNLK